MEGTFREPGKRERAMRPVKRLTRTGQSIKRKLEGERGELLRGRGSSPKIRCLYRRKSGRGWGGEKKENCKRRSFGDNRGPTILREGGRPDGA